MSNTRQDDACAPKFPLGRLMSTPGAIELLNATQTSPLALLRLHVSGRWGQLCEEDKAANDEAVETGARILSAYELPLNAKGGSVTRIWVITEADKSATTLLLPEEY